MCQYQLCNYFPSNNISVSTTSSGSYLAQTFVTKNASTVIDKVAVFVPNPLYCTGLPRLENGYNIISTSEAEQWMKISDKVREASPQELAVFFGV